MGNPRIYLEDAVSIPAPRRVKFGTSAALLKGRAVCFDEDLSVDAGKEIRRRNTVEVPSISNGAAFAGVLADNYNAETGGRTIEIHGPGAECLIYVDGAYSQGDLVSFLIDDAETKTGQFGYFNGTVGRGTARLLETTTEAGFALAVLLDGPETGGTHLCQVVSASALATTPRGLTLITGGITIAANATLTLTVPEDAGAVKSFLLAGALTTGDFVVTPSSAFSFTGLTATNLATATIDGAGDSLTLEAVGPSGAVRWALRHFAGTALSAS